MHLINKKSICFSVLILLILSSFCINAKSDSRYNSTDIENLNFKQELTTPIDTSLQEAKLQPIDINIIFSNPCYAIDEKIHSIRIGYDDGKEIFEIDSQIYDLEHSDDSHIKSCNIVFLIPEEANGEEKYYVFYDSKEVQPTDYEDHLKIDDTNYFYEPISGQKIQFDYYGIYEDDYIIYGIIQKGEILGNPVAQNIIKNKPKSTKVDTTAIDQLASFDLRYGVKGEPDYLGSSAATKVKKRILVDGNLMVRINIESLSPDSNIKTNNIYTYYFCPTDTKRIYVNVNHEVKNQIDIEDPDVLDGIYAGIISIKSRSNTIEKMNVGEILPSFNLYCEDETIKQYDVPPDPKSVEKELILSTEDDIDIGSKAWVSLSDSDSGKTHGLILGSNKGFSDDEYDGIQIKSYVKQNIKLPGLEADTGSVFLGRNTYDKGSSHQTILPKDLKINFGVLFITDENDGYEKLDSESEIIQTLIKNMPIFKQNISKEDEIEKFKLTSFIHFAPSAPMGSLLSALLGRNIPYIYAELYKENDLKSSGSASRLPLGAIDLDLEGKGIFEKIKTVFGMFDWKNATFFKKIVFPDLEAGTYLVKIFRENRLFGKESKYIGFGIVELKNNQKIHIFCGPEAKINCNVKNKDNKEVENVKFLLEQKGIAISDDITDSNGTVVLKAPVNPSKKYNLKVIYQGFLVSEKQIKLGLLNSILKVKETFSIDYHDLNINVLDTWNFNPAISLNPTLTSNEMIEPVTLISTMEDDGKFTFSNLFPANYLLNMKYKSFEINKEVNIQNDEQLDLIFPAEYVVSFDFMDSYGRNLDDGNVIAFRNGKEKSSSINNKGRSDLIVPPGTYDILVRSKNVKISQLTIDVRGDKKIDVLTSKEPFLNNLIVNLCIFLAIGVFLFMIIKKRFFVSIKLFVIIFLIFALVTPWWELNGENETLTTSTKTLLVPSKIVSLSTSSEVLGGDVSQVPSEVTLVLNLLSIIIILSSLIILFGIILKNRFQKISKILSILSLVFLILTLVLFYYVMSQITEVGVGSFIGKDNLDISIPGTADNVVLLCNWGPGFGFYLVFLSLITLIIASFFYKKYKN